MSHQVIFMRWTTLIVFIHTKKSHTERVTEPQVQRTSLQKQKLHLKILNCHYVIQVGLS